MYLEDQDNEDENLGFLTLKLKLVTESFECEGDEANEDQQQNEPVAAVHRVGGVDTYADCLL